MENKTWWWCAEKPEGQDVIEKIAEVFFGGDSPYSICVKRVVYDSGLCLKVEHAPYRYAGRIERGVCLKNNVVSHYRCWENWGGTGCRVLEERKVSDEEYNRLVARVSAIERPSSAEEVIEVIRLILNL